MATQTANTPATIKIKTDNEALLILQRGDEGHLRLDVVGGLYIPTKYKGYLTTKICVTDADVKLIKKLAQRQLTEVALTATSIGGVSCTVVLERPMNTSNELYTKVFVGGQLIDTKESNVENLTGYLLDFAD